MLYVFDEIDALDDDYPRRCMPYLSEQRREKVLTYRYPLDRKLSAAAFMLLRLALRENHGIDEPVVFSYGTNEKPFLRDYPHIQFNVSHCARAVACVISKCEIGVDVQEIGPVSDDLAKRVLTEREYKSFTTAGNPFRQFCEYWTIKESWLKKTGMGIGTDLTALSAEDIREKTLFVEGNRYCCCVAGAAVPLRRVTIRELLSMGNSHESIVS